MKKYDKVRDQVVSLYAAGVMPQELERLYGIPQRTIQYWAQRAGVSRSRGGRTQAFPTELVEAYKNGLPVYKVAQLGGKSEKTVCRRLKELGIDIRPQHFYLDKFSKHEDNAGGAYILGATIDELAEDLNVHRWTVARRLSSLMRTTSESRKLRGTY